MNAEESYVEADSTNLPKVSTLMLFDFLKGGRKFSYAEFESDKENLAPNKYGDDSIGYVSVLRNSYYCVVKAKIVSEQDAIDSCIPVRALIHETKYAIFKIECKKCMPVDCIHGFALLLWLHRRTEESVEQVINYYQKPGTIFNSMLKGDTTEDYLLTPRSSNQPLQPVTGNYLNHNNCSPETKLFLHGTGIFSQSSACSSQQSQTAYHSTQRTSEATSQKSNSGSEFSQTSSSEVISQDGKTENPVQPLSQIVDHTYSTQLSQAVYGATQHTSDTLLKSNCYSQAVYRTTQHTPEDTSLKSNCDSKVSTTFNSLLVTREHCKTDNSAFVQPQSQQVNTFSTQRSQTVYCSTQQTSEDTLVNSRNDAEFQHTFNSQIATREYCEAESSALTQPPSEIVVPLTQITNTENLSSPKQSKTARRAPYSQNKSAKAISPKTLKKQTLLSKKVSQLVKQPKIDNFFIKPKVDVDEGKPQLKRIFMGELVKNFLKLNKGTVDDFMRFAEKQMTEFLCREAELLTQVQRTDLWMDLRYGRITASIIHEAANCHTINGSLVNKILGKVGRYQSPAMKRGIDLESKILHQVQIQENLTTKSAGLFLVPWCPIIGASPDAIGSDFIVEIKAPISDTTFQNFLSNGNISKKCKSQMYLQMYCTGMKRGVFCVADPNFERNKKVTTVWLDYDEEFNEILEKAKMFWYGAIFPRLVNL